MAANLVRRYAPDEAHHLLNLSFAQFHADRAVVRLESPARAARRKLLEQYRGRGASATAATSRSTGRCSGPTTRPAGGRPTGAAGGHGAGSRSDPVT